MAVASHSDTTALVNKVTQTLSRESLPMGVMKQGAELTIPGPPDRDGKPTERRYVFSAMGPQVRTLLARHLKSRAWSELDSQRLDMDVARYNRVEAALMQAMAAGQYEYGGTVHQMIADERAGTVAEALARLRPHHPDANEQTVEEIVNATSWQRLIAAIRAADGPPVPNELPPSEPTGGQSMTSESYQQSLGATPERTPKPSTA